MRLIILMLTTFTLIYGSLPLYAEDFHLDSPYNLGMLRIEFDNDVLLGKDSNFSNGWSIQYHTKRYDSWDDTEGGGFIKWVGNHVPTLESDDSIVRNTHGIGQNMMTPGNIDVKIPQDGDLPYAGTLTYTINWQRFNRETASVFQVSLGLLGEEAFADECQTFVHVDLGMGDEPMGWDTQRDTEPILNIGYRYSLNLVDFGQATNGWGGQIEFTPTGYLGNLYTALDLGIGIRYGWNRQEGFSAAPSPPGRGMFQSAYIPKPKNASPHSYEVLLGLRGAAILYSVLYDGSLITSDDRDVDREDFALVGGAGLFYHYLNSFSVRLYFQASTDVVKEDSLPDPVDSDADETSSDVGYGAIVVDFHY